MCELIYPTVNLFLYDVRDGLGANDEDIYENRRNFWRKISPDLDNKCKRILEIDEQVNQLKKQGLSDETLKLEVDLLWDKIKTFTYEKQKLEKLEASSVELCYEDTDYLDGFYFALQIGDIYSLQVEVSDVTTKDEFANRSNTTVRPLDQLTQLKQLVISKINHHDQSRELDSDKLATLGQTCFAWGQVSKGKTKDEELQKIAEKCFPYLIPDNQSWEPNFTNVGEWLGAKIFEYTYLPKDWGNDLDKFRRESYHLVILLFPDDGTSIDILKQRIADDITDNLNKLFAYRHKIIWAYWNSHYLKVKLRGYFQEISDLRKEISDYSHKTFDLAKLEENVKKSWLLLENYANDLMKLNSQSYTIKTNIGNYRKRLEEIEKNSALVENKNSSNNKHAFDLKIFQKFATTAEERYLQQVNTDYTNLSGGLTILENLTRTIDTLVNIERTKVESQQNTTIAIAGLGLAASSAFAGIAATQVYQPDNKSDGIHWIQGLCFSLIPVVITLLIWLYFKKKR